MKGFIKKIVPVFVVSFLSSFFAVAEQVNSLDFTGITNSEKVIITINSKYNVMEYYTPSRTSKYEILDYDYNENLNSGEQTLKCTVLDLLYNTAYEVLLYSNQSFSDIRIGRKRVAFKYVPQFTVESKK